MRVATILFTYHRSSHTEQVLNGLKENYVLPEMLFVFQDGLKDGEDRTEWDKVNALIHNIKFCPTELVVSECNKGLANSIRDGVNYAFEKYDAVIVLEDDCVPSKNFVNFMLQGLEHYESVKHVYSVTGYANPTGLKKKGDVDVYATGRAESLGWGTWKDRWSYYSVDDKILERILSDPSKSIYLAEWGKDLIGMLMAQLSGKIDSWAVYWALTMIEQKGICVCPFLSHIKNIGFDGTGVHSGNNLDSPYATVELETQNYRKYKYPKNIQLKKETKKAFASVLGLGSYVLLKNDESLPSVWIYGLGNFFMQHEKKICQQFYIAGFIDQKKSGYFAGVPIIKPYESSKYYKEKVVIMIADDREREKVRNYLMNTIGIAKDNIISTEEALSEK